MPLNGLVNVRDVHKHFTRGSERIEVLKGVNLEIPKGDFLALMGPSSSEMRCAASPSSWPRMMMPGK